MWICLRVNKSIIRRGAITHYRPGDWVDVGRQTADQWILAGEAFIVDPAESEVPATSGVVVRGILSDDWRKRLADIPGLQLAFSDGGWHYDLPFTETLLWTPGFTLRLDLLIKGFDLLKRWQVIVPLFDYETLALHVGTEAERAHTKAVIRDLRVPLRDTRLVYIRRCEATRALMAAWQTAAQTCREERLAFMQALYTVKPLVCDVPASWTGKQ